MNCGTKRMKKGGMTMKPKKYQEGGRVRQGMQSPAASRARSEEAEVTMRRERAAEDPSKMERRRGREEEFNDPGIGREIENMFERRRMGYKAGGQVAPKKMQSGGMANVMGFPDRARPTPMRRPMQAPTRVSPPMMSGRGAAPATSIRPPQQDGRVSIMPVRAMKKGGKVAPKKGMK